MIPKIIHYCWFGKGEKSESIKKCMDSWRKFLPDYEFMEWNEENFDINSNYFTKFAYQNKKWAFVSDYVRIKALQEYGGIYLDTDIEIVKPFTNELLSLNSFTCFEDLTHVSTSCIGAQKGATFLDGLKNYYESINENSNFSLVPNTELIFNILFPSGVKSINNITNVGNLTIYTRDYFIAKDYVSGKIYKTDNTFCIHHYNATWKSKKDRKKDGIKKFIRRVIGEKNYFKLKKRFKGEQNA